MLRFSRVAAAALLLAPFALGAQRATRVGAGTFHERAAAGASFTYGRPTGDFLTYVKQGFGIDGFFRWNLDPEGILSLRIDGGYLSYGHEKQRVPLSTTVGGRILVDLTTSNNIVYAGIGPQLTAPSGPVRPYANIVAGFSYFFTESSVQGSNDNNEPFAHTTNFDDGTFNWSYGGGVLIPIGVRGDFAIDLGARVSNNGKVKYLRKGSIVDLPGGDIQITPIESQANLIVFRVGVSAAIR